MKKTLTIKKDFYDKKIHERQYKIKVDFIWSDWKKQTDVDITLTGDFDWRPDCNINHFWANFFFRTSKGEKYEEYANLQNMMKSVVNELEKKSFKITKVVISNNDSSYSDKEKEYKVEDIKDWMEIDF